VAHAVLAEERRLETLLGDLLVLASDDESTSAATHTATVDLALVAAEEAARAHPVPVTIELSGDDDLEAFVVAGVAPRLGRAVTNLVDNACRHAVSQVRVSLQREDSRVRLLVDDDGPGVALADRERIFERFTRLDDSRARDRGGAGLGLAVVRSVVTRHGGFVWADQSPLGGARFTVELPAATVTA
jgi:signal transduction histidine kinase